MTREEQMMDLARSAESNSRTIDLSKKQVFMSAYIQGWKDADSNPKWIPVKEELPKERKVVWVRKHFNKEILGEFDIYDSAAFCNGEFQCDNSGNVTHWMEIVPPRKEENNES